MVSYLINNPGFGATNFIPDFLDMCCEGYLCKIQSDDTFGDEITLRVISEIFKVEFDVYLVEKMRPLCNVIRENL